MDAADHGPGPPGADQPRPGGDRGVRRDLKADLKVRLLQIDRRDPRLPLLLKRLEHQHEARAGILKEPREPLAVGGALDQLWTNLERAGEPHRYRLEAFPNADDVAVAKQ